VSIAGKGGTHLDTKGIARGGQAEKALVVWTTSLPAG